MDAWPLGAIDLFHLHTHEELAAGRLGPNSCAVAAELEGRVPVAELRARVEHAAAQVPELRWRVHRDRRFERIWRATGGAPTVREMTGDGLDAIVALLSDAIDGRAPWRLFLLHGRENDTVVLNWFHSATDARGAARLLSWLSGEDSVPGKRWMTGDRLLEKLSSAEQRELTQRYIQHAIAIGRRPILSLQRTAPRRAAPGPQRAIRLRLDADETRAFDGSLRKRAGLADTSVLLWAAARMVDGLVRRRGFCPVQQVVPLPLSLDPKKGSTRMFGNHLTMMLMTLDRDDLADEARAVAHLAAQRRDIVRDKLDVAMLAAIRASRHIPRLVADWVARRPFGGERSSFVMSNPGVVDVPDRLFGRDVLDAFAVPTLLPAPGFQVTADRFGDRLSVMIMLREGYVTVGEVMDLVPELRTDILGSA